MENINEEYEETSNDNYEESIDNKNDIQEVSKVELTNKETFYFKIIDKYYKSLDKTKVKTMIDIVEGDSKISLRLMDWFITRYSNKYKIRYQIDDEDDNPGVDKLFNVHISYKAQLKSYKKKYFDPFRRRKKFKYYFDKEKSLILHTTIGQLNFFKWAFTNDVVKYISLNYNAISKAMISTNKIDKTKKIERKTKTDEEIVVNKNGINIVGKKNVKNDEVKIVLSFD